MTRIGRIDAAIRAQGLPLTSVRELRGGAIELVHDPAATPTQRAEAQQIADTFTRSARHKMEDAARKRGITVLQLAVARRELARARSEVPPAWTAQVIQDELSGVDSELA